MFCYFCLDAKRPWGMGAYKLKVIIIITSVITTNIVLIPLGHKWNEQFS